jgi:hypothetical protein
VDVGGDFVIRNRRIGKVPQSEEPEGTSKATHVEKEKPTGAAKAQSYVPKVR